MKKRYIQEDKYFLYDRKEIVGIRYIARRVINIFHRFFYKLMYMLLKPNGDGKNKYKVSICAIFKDEADYLKEWIEFHRLVGIEHFYLYNNNSTDDYQTILQSYIDEGVVSLKNWPIKQGQMQAYKDFMDTNAAETEWVGFIDIDEFVVPNKYDNVYEFLKKFSNRPSVIIYWKFFGTSGKIRRNIKGLLTEEFVTAWPKYVNIGKFFFNTKYEYDFGYKLNSYMHSTWGKYKGIHLPAVNLFDRVCSFGCNSVPNDDMPIQINHYVIKSYQEYVEKKSKRGGGVHPDMHNLEYFYYHEKRCQTVDYAAYKYLIQLKRAMGIED